MNTCRLSSAMPSPAVPLPVTPTPLLSSEPNAGAGKPSRLPPPPPGRPAKTSPAVRRKGGERRRTSYWRRSGAAKNLDLTTESLEKFNRRNAAKKDSPYYYGLTDSTLYFQKLAGSASPGRESLATTATAGTSSSISTVLMKIQRGVVSCFKGKADSDSTSRVKSSATPSASTCSSSKPMVVKSCTGGSSFEEKPLREKVVSETVAFEEKPLREKVVSETVAAVMPPVVVAKSVFLVGEKPKDANAMGSRFVLADKYRPITLKDFICNRDKAEQLHAMGKNGQCNHYIFEGLPGVGKKTMIWAFLREVYGPKLMTWEECKEFELKGELLPNIRVNVKVSSKHVEVNLSELNGYEKHVIVALIKEAQNRMGSNQTTKCDHTNCYVIVIHEADKLSTDAQLYIRWLMEKDKSCNRISFCCHDATKLQHIRSLCTVIQLLPPSNKEIVEVLEFIAKKEGIHLPNRLAERIAENSKHNLRQAIRSFEASWQSNYPFKEDQVIKTGWEEDTANIAKDIIQEQSPKQLYIIRGKLQNLIEHNVSPEFTFMTLVTELKKHLSDEFQSKINALFQEYNRDTGNSMDSKKSIASFEGPHEISIVKSNNDLRRNVQHFMRIEEFTAKFMSFYKSHKMGNSRSPIHCAY